MQHIWAPWRMDYVSGPRPQGCFLCRAPREPDEFGVLVKTEGAFVMLNAYPYNSGHVMVVPYAHVPSLVDLDAEQLAHLSVLTKAVLTAMERTLRPGGYNIGVNIGAVAGAGVPDHVHVHVVPRWEGDTNFMSVVADTRVVPEALQAAAERLGPALERVCGELGLETIAKEDVQP
ncbi:MAG: HIT domain-containing protein [Armatimonadetes bacterium]|nr:HIT domain-containing protein [Armatimonadota bacterium]